MAERLVLFSTDHCSLCETALELLLSMPELAGWAVHVVDVADDDRLLSCYGERLPVLRFESGTDIRELNWPFDNRSIARLLARADR